MTQQQAQLNAVFYLLFLTLSLLTARIASAEGSLHLCRAVYLQNSNSTMAREKQHQLSRDLETIADMISATNPTRGDRDRQILRNFQKRMIAGYRVIYTQASLKSWLELILLTPRGRDPQLQKQINQVIAQLEQADSSFQEFMRELNKINPLPATKLALDDLFLNSLIVLAPEEMSKILLEIETLEQRASESEKLWLTEAKAFLVNNNKWMD